MPKKSLSDSVLRHLLDESFERHNVFSRDYNADVVEHLLRFHWTVLETLRDDGDLDAICIHADLLSAVALLPLQQRQVVVKVMEGRPTTEISAEMKCNASRIAKLAFKTVAEHLNGREAVA